MKEVKWKEELAEIRTKDFFDYAVQDERGRTWKVVSDSSITCRTRTGRNAGNMYAVEFVSPMCFSNLPSRCSCVWLCRENQIDYWKKFIPGDVEVFEVEVCERRMFKSRNLLIPLPSDSYAKILEKAKVYWSYQSSDENEDDEYLYNGEVLVIRQV